MAQPYFDDLNELITALTAEHPTAQELEVKHFFSGAAVYANGKICMSLTPVGLAIKVPTDVRDTLIDEHGAKPLQYFPKAPVKKEYAVLPDSIINDREALRRWVEITFELMTRE